MKLPNHKQRGVVLLLILLVLVVAGSTLALSAMNSTPVLRSRLQRDQQIEMLRAKEALLAYAAQGASIHGNTRGPGFFPCPDTAASDADNDGILSDSFTTDCAGYDSASTPLVGRLPIALDAATHRYELNDSDAGIDQQFWYAVGNRYVSISLSTSPTTALRNSVRRTSKTFAEATGYRMTLDGTPGYVALIIAPGDALPTQNRTTGPNDHINYLDHGNGDTFAFITSFPPDLGEFNDLIIGITLDEYMRAVGIPVATEIKRELDEYWESVIGPSGTGHYPDSPGYTDFPLEPSTPGSQDEFLNVFYGTPAATHSWMRDGTVASFAAGNNENWPSFSHYFRTAESQAQIVFRGCEGMIYTIDYTSDGRGGVKREGESC